MERLIVSLAGNPASGKTDVAKHLEDAYGFTTVRPSGLIRAYAENRGIPLRERRDYSQTFNDMIAEEGSDKIVEQMLDSTDGNLCVDGERLPQHIMRLRKHGAVVIALWCPIQTRYERAMERADERDKVTFEEFKADEASEYQSTEPPGISTLTVMQMADYHLDGSKEPRVVQAAVEDIVELHLAA